MMASNAHKGDCQASPEGLCEFVLVNVPPVVVIRLVRQNRAGKNMIPVRFNMLYYVEMAIRIE